MVSRKAMDELRTFAPHGTLLSVMTVHPEDFVHGKADPVLIQAVETWLARRRRATLPPLCMTCNHEWGRNDLGNRPSAFVVIYNAADRKAIVSGLCKACDQAEDREAAVLAVVRIAFGDYEICARGTATTQ